MAKRQTIWLSTMMVLSLMLIGFYTVNNNVQEVSTADTAKTQTANQAAGDASNETAAPSESSDYFIGYHLENNQKISKKEEELQQVIATGKSADEIDKAKQELEAMTADQEKIDNVIGLLFKEGYPDAIIEKNNDKINVTVQAQQLDKKSAVKIMDMVAKEMSVPSRMVTVAHHE